MEQREVLTVHAFSVLSSALIAKRGPLRLRAKKKLVQNTNVYK